MTSNILELRNFTDSSFRTLVRKCHNNKNLLIVNQEFNSRTGEWETDDRDTMMLPMKFLKPILSYAHLHDTFQILKTPSPKKPKSKYSPDEKQLYGYCSPVITRNIQTSSLSSASKRLFQNYDYQCIPITQNWEQGELQSEEVGIFWEFQETPEVGSVSSVSSASSSLDVTSFETPKKESQSSGFCSPSRCHAPAGKRVRFSEVSELDQSRIEFTP